MSLQRVAVVTGANRGIGLATVRALCKKFDGAVYLTSRNRERGEEAIKSLNSEDIEPNFHVLDTSDQYSLGIAKKYLIEKYGGVDIFVHNVGIMFKNADPTPFGERAKQVIKANYLDMVDVCNVFLPIMKDEGRFVILSSGLSLIALQGCSKEVQNFFKAEITEEQLTSKLVQFVESAQTGDTQKLGFEDHPYGMSKLGVNAFTRILAKRVREMKSKNVLVNCCCPGWVKTSMGGPDASFSPDQGAQIPVMLSLIPAGSTEPNGEFYQRRRLVKWYSD